ncbi:hypothetical protein N7492_002780 [Penicillium capsulatum]|uniref:C2H2-type domain-containing protein n=1 Tax=Penicillium capsulatum TaxID=69766 RepID=A0A9W9IJ93_9EURO|nr:hypothetical protein N7492_002780 [Penicillium capsulatum]KAJ6122623.1 hypothetical protein N7512_005088 [Penicillium capsulatum]
MPWSAQACPFCPKQYANKTGLLNHLLRYVAAWRLPADGVHDVLKCMDAIRLVSPTTCAEDDGRRYRCWTCFEVFKSLPRFRDHVIYRGHCQEVPRWKTRPPKKRAMRLPFDIAHVLVPEREFPFMELPLEIRMMIYEHLLRFDNVYLSYIRKDLQEPRYGGRWLQYNPAFNALAILSTSLQIYNEARWVFYGFNTFIFDRMSTIPIFLVGIGAHNALRLRSVKCHRASAQQPDLVTEIKRCVRRSAPGANDLSPFQLVWNLEFLYARFSTENSEDHAGHEHESETRLWFYFQTVAGSRKPQGGIVSYELCKAEQ